MQRGFTLVEMVMALVITSIIAATATIFLRPAIEAYFGMQRRADLTDQADLALRLMVRDIRSAVPNSVRTPGSQCFELIPTSAGGAYRSGPDTVNDSPAGCSTPSGTCSAPLDTTRATTAFDVLSISPSSYTPAVGDWVFVGSQSATEAYASTTPSTAQRSRAQITAVATPRASDGVLRLTVGSTQFPYGYDGGRFVIVPDSQKAVFYVCSGADGGVDASGDGKGTLYRLRNYGFNATAPASCPSTAGADVVATQVRSCSFVYSPNQGATQQNGFVSLQLELARGSEIVSLSHGAHVNNVP